MSVRSAEVLSDQTSYDAAPVPLGGVPDLHVLVWQSRSPAARALAFVTERVDRLQHAPVGVRRALAGVMAAAVAVAGLASLAGGSETGLPRSAPAAAVDAGVGRSATAAQPLVDVYASPGAERPATTLANPTALGVPLVFAVTAQWQDWFRVALPTPPAGSTGWIRAEAVNVSEHRMRVTVDVVAREIVLRDGGDVVFRAPLAVGAHDGPPPGATFVSEVLTLSNPETAYGTHALGLAGFPNSPDKLFRGGGMVAIHGTNDAGVIRTGRTSGSIALTNADAERLASLVAPGTPVDVVGELERGAPTPRGDTAGP